MTREPGAHNPLFFSLAIFLCQALFIAPSLHAQQSCENIAGAWHMEETATLKCTVTAPGLNETYSDSLGASRDVTIAQTPGSCFFTYDPGTIGAGQVVQYYRTQVIGEIAGNTVTTSGGSLIPAPGVQLIEASFSANGQLSGNTMTLSGSGSFKINQRVEGGLTANLSCTLTSTAVFTRSPQPPPLPLSITTSSPLPNGTVGVSYVQTVTASGGTPPYTWSVNPGTLPPGLLLTSAGVISGTPTTAGAYNFTIQVSGGGFATRAFSLTINNSRTNFQWIHQFGSSGDDRAQDVAVNTTGVYVVGEIAGTVSGFLDAYVRKYDGDGNELWTRQFGTATTDIARAVAADNTGVYVAGYTAGTLPGQTSAGGPDVFLRKYDINGAELWTRQFGSAVDDYTYGVAVDATGVYVAGYTAGTLPGQTSAGGQDAFLRKYDINGTELWTRQFGSTSLDYAYGIAVDATGVYVAGYTEGTLSGQTSAGGQDGFARKYDGDGNVQWTRQFGSSTNDVAVGAAVSATGFCVSGYTFGTLPGETSVGGIDAFARCYDESGNVLWTRQFGSSGNDFAYAIAVDGAGTYVAGQTWNVLPGQSSLGNHDAFILKLDVRTAPASVPLTVDTGGTRTVSTGGTAANLRSGYATATVDAGVTPYGTAVFSLFQNGVVVSEAGVPASPPTQSARMFIDYRTGVPASAGTLNISTGIAIANRGSSSATIAYTLRDRNAQIVATGQGNLAASAHFAKFIQELRDVAPDFSMPTNFSTAIRFGSLEITSNQPVSIVALRLTTNQRGETLLTSTPIADLSTPVVNSPVYFPQLVDGGGNTTTLLLLNTSKATESGTLAIFDDNGAALTLRDSGGTMGSTFPYSIPAGGAFVFQTDGTSTSTRAGWMKVSPSAGTSAPVGAGMFSYSRAGILVTESGVPAAVPTTNARIYVDKSSGHDTGLAIANPGSSSSSIVLQAYQNNGSTTAGNGPVILNIPVGGHFGKFVGQLIGGLPDDFTGVLQITSTSPFVALTLRSLSNSRGDFLLTTFPIADTNQAPPAPIVFPQIVDGAGNKTQFIFISATGPATLTLNFIGDDGSPLEVGTAVP